MEHVKLCFSFHTVPTAAITTYPFGPIEGAMVGSSQVINCTVSTVSGVESSSVMISWMGPGGVITNDDRVTVGLTFSGNTYTSSLQFTYLMEGDEGTYTCNVMILETNGSRSVELLPLGSQFSRLGMYQHTPVSGNVSYRKCQYACKCAYASLSLRRKIIINVHCHFSLSL